MKDRLITIMAAIGMFMSMLDTGIINIAIPSLIKDLETSLALASLTVTLYTLALCISILMFGVLADRFGRIKIYKYGLWVFLMSSILCALSQNIFLLILFRSIQGLGAAMLQATAISIVMSLVSESKRNNALSLVIAFAGAGPIVGPALGGMLMNVFGWQIIFIINIPMCLIGIYLCNKFKGIDIWHKSKINKISLIAITLSAISITILLNMLSNISIHPFAFILSVFISIIVLISTYLYEFWSEDSIINRKYLVDFKIVAAMLSLFAMGFCTVIIFMLPPLYLTVYFKMGTFKIGLIALIAPLAMMIFSKNFHFFIQKVNSSIILCLGLLSMIASLMLLNYLDESTSLLYLSVSLFIFGIGVGLIQPSATLILMSQIEKSDQSVFSAFSRMQVNFAIATGAVIISLFIPNLSDNLISLMNPILLIAIILTIWVLILSLLSSIKIRYLSKQRT